MSKSEPFIIAVTVTGESGPPILLFQYDLNDRDSAHDVASTFRKMLEDGFTVSCVHTDA